MSSRDQQKEVVILCFARLWYFVWDPGVLCLGADLQQTELPNLSLLPQEVILAGLDQSK